MHSEIKLTLTIYSSQPFWGNMVSVAGAGPPPIDAKNMNPEILSSAIRFLLSPEALTAAGIIADKMCSENGVKTAVDSFHRHLSVKDMSCSMLPNSPATWSIKTKKGKDKVVLKLSHRAASVLVEEKKIDVKDLRLYEPSLSTPILIVANEMAEHSLTYSLQIQIQAYSLRKPTLGSSECNDLGSL